MSSRRRLPLDSKILGDSCRISCGCNLKTASLAVKNRVYPEPRARNFTSRSVCPSLASNCSGSWLRFGDTCVSDTRLDCPLPPVTKGVALGAKEPMFLFDNHNEL